MPLTALLLSLSLTPQAYADCDLNGDGLCDDLVAIVAADPRPSDPLRVSRGQVTFDAEGNDNPNSPYFSRVLHWPEGASGVTIGRGYDMRHRSAEQVLADLLQAGVDRTTAEIMSQGAGLSHSSARNFVRNHSDLSITREAQQALFEVVYSDYSDMTRELVCRWSGTSGAACSSLWDSMDPTIQTTLVDLRYRGDLTRGRWNRLLDDAVLANDLETFADIMSNRGSWSAVPQDRFNRRVEFLEEATSSAPLTSIRPIPRPADLGTATAADTTAADTTAADTTAADTTAADTTAADTTAADTTATTPTVRHFPPGTRPFWPGGRRLFGGRRH